MTVLKWMGISILGLLLSALIGISLFIYKIGDGFDSFEDTPPPVNIDEYSDAILVFSKTNGFRHGEAIEVSTALFQSIAKTNGWEIFVTENAAIFNTQDLRLFDVVIWNNATGRNLTDDQRVAFRTWIEDGGGFLGIHGAGDFSHDWDWYESEVIKASFSHHNMDMQPIESTLSLETDTTYLELSNGLEATLTHSDEWYIFFDNPRENGANILYTMDESRINPSGNMSLLVTDKDFGMGQDHPSVWYHELGGSRVFYSALGHHPGAFESKTMHRMLENAIIWVGRF